VISSPAGRVGALVSSSLLSRAGSESNVRLLTRFLVFAWLMVGLGLAMASWAVAAPLMSSADEPAQAINAAAVVQGQLDEPFHAGPDGRISTVNVPAYIASLGRIPGCYAFRSSMPASCAPPIQNSTRSEPVAMEFSNYPPLYFALTGLPTLFLSGARSLYAMRLVSAAVSSALLALGLYLLVRYHPRRLALLAGVLAITPMVLYLGAMITDSGMETAAGFATWCGAVCIVEQGDVPRSLAVWTSVAALLFVLSRPLSGLYAVILLAVAAVLAGRDRTAKLAAQAPVRLFAAVVVVALLIAAGFLAVGGVPSLLGTPEPARLTFLGEMGHTLGLTGDRLVQGIGDFGWLDTPVPLLATLVWSIAVVALMCGALLVSPRSRRALPLLTLAIVALPVAIEAPRVNALGTFWQGRYWLPLLVGLPLLAATSIRPNRQAILGWTPSPRVMSLGCLPVLGLLVLGQVCAFLTAVHRYGNGLGTRPGSSASWRPPGGSGLLVILFGAGEVIFSVGVAWLFIVRAPRGGRD
jgi:hypothetical protein